MGREARHRRARVLEGVELHPGGSSVPGQPQAFKPRRAEKSKAKLCSCCIETLLRPPSQQEELRAVKVVIIVGSHS